MKAQIELKPGQRAIVVSRTGRRINRYMDRHQISVCIVNKDGGKDYRGHRTPYWIYNSKTYANHHRTGLNKADLMDWNLTWIKAMEIANSINNQ